MLHLRNLKIVIFYMTIIIIITSMIILSNIAFVTNVIKSNRNNMKYSKKIIANNDLPFKFEYK